MAFLVRIARILWGWRLLVATATICSVLGGLYVIATFPPRYEASSKVELDIIKPDPVTGFHVGSKNIDAYMSSQMQMIRDFQVAIRAASDMGWLDAPEMQAAYAGGAASGSGMDFNHWVAARIIGGLLINADPDSNLLVIRYRADTPDMARAVADAVRNAYLEETLDIARGSAAGAAAANAARAEIARAKLAELGRQRTAFERATGIMLQANDTDADSAKLGALAGSLPAPSAHSGYQRGPGTDSKLAEAEAALAAASKTLGPNHPTVAVMRTQRDLLARQLAAQRSGMTDQANATSAMERVRAEQMKAQVAKVLGQREELTKARLLQDEIKMWQDQYQEASQRAGEQKELSNLASTSVSPVGTTVAPTRPVFPNLSLILVGATALGLALGVLLALFSEMLGRRVRMASDVTTIVAGATFATIPLVRFPRGRRPQSATRDRTLRDRRAAAKRPRTKSGGKVAQQ